MASITKSAEVPAGADAIWPAVSTPSRFADWQTIHVGFNGEPPAELNVGDTFKQKVTMMGMPGEVEWTVTELEAPTKVVLDGKGPMGTKATAAITVSAEGDSSTVTYETGFDGAALKPMASALEKNSAQAAEESLEKLKALVS
jgi:carbon monoxide dehydrogenase subunit G